MSQRKPYHVDEVSKDGSIGLTNEDFLHCGFQWKEEWGLLPRKGDIFYVDGGFGQTITEISRPDGTVLISPEEFKRKNDEMIAGWAQERLDSLERNREQWKADVAALDEPWRERMQRFINESGFDTFFSQNMGGEYELFVCQQSNSLYRRWVDSGTWMSTDWFDWFGGLKYEEQKEEWPGMNDGHSGYTFDCTVGMAKRVALGWRV